MYLSNNGMSCGLCTAWQQQLVSYNNGMKIYGLAHVVGVIVAYMCRTMAASSAAYSSVMAAWPAAGGGGGRPRRARSVHSFIVVSLFIAFYLCTLYISSFSRFFALTFYFCTSLVLENCTSFCIFAFCT